MQAQATCAARTRRSGPAPKPRGKRSSTRPPEADWQYRQARELVMRRSFVTLADIRGLGIMTEPARQLLLRLQREGVVAAPDLFGTWTRVGAEVAP